MSLYTLHGLLQVLAFAFLFPIGSLVAVMRHRFGPSWLTWHVGFQLAGSAAVLGAVILAHFAGRKHTHDKSSALRRAHRAVGYSVVGLILIQLLWAYLGRRTIAWNVWLFVHATLATLILVAGWTNIALAIKMKENV